MYTLYSDIHTKEQTDLMVNQLKWDVTPEEKNGCCHGDMLHFLFPSICCKQHQYEVASYVFSKRQ